MIYLDYAAATPVSSKALKAMEPYFADQFFNPSAAYLLAKHVREAYESAKARLAHAIGAKGTDLVITSGATEANNLAIGRCDGSFEGPKTWPSGPERPEKELSRRPIVLALATEHPSVLALASATISVDHSGLIDLEDLKCKLAPDTRLVSVSLANNELGTIQPLAEISAIIRAERMRRLQDGNTTPLYLHSDASQAQNLIDINVARLGVDLLTLNSAKVYGPKGVGALYVAHGIKLNPITLGGGQENGLRSGTENVPGLIGFATAAEEAKKHLAFSRKNYANLAKIMTEVFQSFAQAHPEINFRILGNSKHRLANFLPVCFDGIDAERLIYRLEDAGIYVSTGAACAASKGQKSHVLTAIGLSDSEIAGSLRISLGAGNTPENVRAAAEKICEAVLAERSRL